MDSLEIAQWRLFKAQECDVRSGWWFVPPGASVFRGVPVGSLCWAQLIHCMRPLGWDTFCGNSHSYLLLWCSSGLQQMNKTPVSQRKLFLSSAVIDLSIALLAVRIF